MRPRICISAGLRFSVTNSGTVRRRITPKPCGSTLQSMTSSVSGHKCSPLCSIRVAPPSPARKTIAAAPSPNRLTAMMLALVNSSWRSASKHSSTATSSTLVPGRACARREAIDRPEAPAAQPSPNACTRETSDRKPMRRATHASRLGLAMLVEQTVATVSIAGGEAGIRQRFPGNLSIQRFGALQKSRGTLRPAAWFEIPFERLHAVTLDDSGVGENAGEPFEIRKAAAEDDPMPLPTHPSARRYVEGPMSPVRSGQPYASRNLSCGFPSLWEHRLGSFISHSAKILGRMDHYDVKFLNVTRSANRKRQIYCRRQDGDIECIG
jgi:hypothetical protein